MSEIAKVISCPDSLGYCPIIMVGAFPPPMHGLAAVNSAMYERLVEAGANPYVINVASRNLNRSLFARIQRLPVAARGWVRLLLKDTVRGGTLYLSASGGLGQLYDMCFVILGRIRGMRIVLHHHSFAYLDKPSFLTHLFIRSAGIHSSHITQSPGMSARLHENYSYAVRITPISNAVFLAAGCLRSQYRRNTLRTLGFISNISDEKGIFEFLDLVAAYEKDGLALTAKIAGPFQDYKTECRVRKRLAALSTVEYVGPKFGEEKEAFFATIDALIFPTRYGNETEGIVNHEAMSRGIPVIAYGRGCIPEIVSGASGLVIDPAESFVPAALPRIRQWLDSSAAYKAASRLAAEEFVLTFDENTRRLGELIGELLARPDDTSTFKSENY